MRTTSLIFGLVTVLNASTAINAQEAVWKTQGVTKDEIVLGMHADLSGVAASFSVGVVNSIRMRIDEVDESGGINGRKLRLVVEDTGYQVPKAIQAANKLINRDGVFAMIGNLGTGPNNAVMPEQLKAGIPNFFPISWADSMSKPFHPLKFALYAPYSEQIRVAVKYMVEKKGKKTVCAMYQDTDYGTEVFNGAKAQLDAMGMKFAEVTTHKPTDQDFTPQLTKLRAANCDLIAMGTIVRDTVIPYSSARKMGWDVDMIGTSGSYDLAVSGVQGGTTEGYYTAGFFDSPYPENARPAAAAWISQYKSRYNIDPTNSGRDRPGHRRPDREGDRERRTGSHDAETCGGDEKIRNYQDIFGGPPQGFSATEHVSSREAVIYRVEKGRWVQLPDSVAVAK